MEIPTKIIIIFAIVFAVLFLSFSLVLDTEAAAYLVPVFQQPNFSQTFRATTTSTGRGNFGSVNPHASYPAGGYINYAKIKFKIVNKAGAQSLRLAILNGNNFGWDRTGNCLIAENRDYNEEFIFQLQPMITGTGQSSFQIGFYQNEDCTESAQNVVFEWYGVNDASLANYRVAHPVVNDNFEVYLIAGVDSAGSIAQVGRTASRATYSLFFQVIQNWSLWLAIIGIYVLVRMIRIIIIFIQRR